MLRALARIDLAAIERHCARLAQIAAPATLCAVVKADAYEITCGISPRVPRRHVRGGAVA